MSKQTMMRRARLRALQEGKVQTVQVQVFDNLGRQAIERMQDYGFAAAPVEGEGLVLEVAGHMMVLRMDQIDKRPQLQANEVALWHRDGHKVTLKAGGKIEVDCDDYVVNAKNKVQFNTPQVEGSGEIKGKTLDIAERGMIDGVDMGNHDHGDVAHGTDRSSGPSTITE